MVDERNLQTPASEASSASEAPARTPDAWRNGRHAGRHSRPTHDPRARSKPQSARPQGTGQPRPPEDGNPPDHFRCAIQPAQCRSKVKAGGGRRQRFAAAPQPPAPVGASQVEAKPAPRCRQIDVDEADGHAILSDHDGGSVSGDAAATIAIWYTNSHSHHNRPQNL